MTHAVPELRFEENSRRHAICQCGRGIKTSCFGWVHETNRWVTLGDCRDAKPKFSIRDRLT